MKTLVIAVGVYNVVLWRSMLATVVSGTVWFSGPWAWPQRSVLKLHVLRSVLIAIVMLTFFWGLARLPLADAIGLSFIAPLLALFLAAVLLGERIGRPAIWASLAGLVGVALIMGGQFELVEYSQEVMHGTIAVLLSTLFYAFNLILARKQAQLAKPTEIMFFQSLLLAIFFLLPAPWLAVSLGAGALACAGGRDRPVAERPVPHELVLRPRRSAVSDPHGVFRLRLGNSVWLGLL